MPRIFDNIDQKLLPALCETPDGASRAEPDGKIEKLCHEIISWNKPLYTLDDPSNANLIELGTKSIAARRKRVDVKGNEERARQILSASLSQFANISEELAEG